MHEEDAFKCLGEDQGEKESWNRIVNTISQALVMTSCHFKASVCIHEKEKDSSGFELCHKIFTLGEFCLVFFFFPFPYTPL